MTNIKRQKHIFSRGVGGGVLLANWDQDSAGQGRILRKLFCILLDSFDLINSIKQTSMKLHTLVDRPVDQIIYITIDIDI